jgi:hypothetical protein
VAAAPVAGTLSDRARSKGQSPGFPDWLSPPPRRPKLTVLTGNLRHFTPLGVQAHNPFDVVPED